MSKCKCRSNIEKKIEVKILEVWNQPKISEVWSKA